MARPRPAPMPPSSVESRPAASRRAPRRASRRSFGLGRCAAPLLAAALSGACTAFGGEAEEAGPPAAIEALPASIASFDYDGYRRFDDGSNGYSVRYANAPKKRLADVYIYPVAEENAELEHEALVLGSTRATLQAIGEAVNQGLYANFAVLDAATRTQGLRTTARVQATYLRDNLASYTLLYQTEHDGTLMKIRLSMPDNESNRANGEWDAFAARVFEVLIDDLDERASTDAGPRAGL